MMPRLQNAMSCAPGTVWWTGLLALVAGTVSAQQVLFSQQTDPPGLFSSSVYTSSASLVVTTNAPLTQSGYSFTHWTLNGTRQDDGAGRSLNPASVTLYQDTYAVAHYTNTASDSNGDGIPDWFEIMYCRGITNAAASDTDGDGANLLMEYNRDTHPSIPDQVVSGGISRRRSASMFMLVASNYSFYSEVSDPPGFVSLITGVSNGSVVATTALHGETNGYTFTYWDVNGVRQSDAAGMAEGRALVTVTGTTVATAHFLLTTTDTNANDLPDWWEILYLRSLTNSVAADADGDGRSLLEEYNRDTSPLISDQIVTGGISRRRSDVIIVNMAGYCRYDIHSSPPGFVMQQSGVVPTGTVFSTSNLNGDSNGYTFAYWSLNGVRQVDSSGRALSQLTATLTGDAVAVANYFSTAADTDSDDLPDWWELQNFGTLANATSSDPDGDGWNLLAEYNQDVSPLIKDRIVAGGTSRRRSAAVAVNLQSFVRVPAALVNGVSQPFFSADPPANGLFSLDGNTAPALGDWDGDGDLDLFVCASSRTMRVYQNAGTPLVCNLIDRTSNFTAIAGAWTNFGNPYPTMGDWNLDGRADLVIGGDQGFVRVLSSTASFASPQTPMVNYILAIGSTSAIPALTDVNGDAYADLLILRPDGIVAVYTNSQNVMMPFAGSTAISNLLVMTVPDATGIATADVNGDGLTDVLVSDSSGSVWEFRRVSGAQFTLRTKVYGGSYVGFANRLTITAGDFNGDGSPDLLGGFAEGGLIQLRNVSPGLLVFPPAVTLASGKAQAFQASHAVGAVNWTFVTNRSGGTISATGNYASGPNASVVDVLEARDATNRVGRAYVNVIGVGDVAAVGRAIVIAGGKSLDDPVWAATDYLGDLAFNTLLYGGFSKSNVQYLSFQPAQDADGNGVQDDIDGSTAMTNVARTFTNWVGNANKLFVYLADHGSDHAGEGYFRLNGTEHLTATQLDAWLDTIQNTYTTEVTVVMDFCYSGSFLDELAYTGTAKRIVIASAASNELTYFIAGGLVSFSSVFFSSVLQGTSVEQSFLNAASAMARYQTPMLDDSGDGTYQVGTDGAVSRTNRLGASFVVGRDVPQIGLVVPDQTLTNGSTAAAWAADIVSTYPLDRVWCSIVAPRHRPDPDAGVPVIDVPQVDLTYETETRRYEASLHGLTEAGTYAVVYQAQDIWGGVSLPRQGLVFQSGVDERFVLVLAGLTNSVRWPGVVGAAAQVYRALLSRRIPASSIRCLSAGGAVDLSGDALSDIQGTASLSNLAYAITNWASPSTRLTVYFVGTDYAAGCRLTATETLTSAQLDGLLDAYQLAARPVNVVMDFPSAGSFIPALLPPVGAERITLASARPSVDAVFDLGGRISFSAFFMGEVMQGRSIGRSYDTARAAIRSASGTRIRQTPQLDDNGNGVPDEKNVEGAIARQAYFGAAFVTGDDAPFVGSVMQGAVAASGTVLTVWATDVLDVDGISNVWAVVTIPGFDGTNDLPSTKFVFNASTGRYEADWMIEQPGTYTFTIFAQDTLGNLSPPIQMLVLTPDAYEVDDTAGQAKAFDPGEVQTHNFHTTNDEDWVMFFAPTGAAFEITATQLSTNSDVKLEVFFLQPDGTLSNLDLSADDYGRGQDEQEYTSLDLLADTNLAPGLYLVRVSNADLDGMGWGLDSEYDLSIYVPVGAGKLTVVAADKLHVGVAPPGAVAYVDGGTPKAFNGAQTVVYQGLSPGYHNVQVTVPAGYVAEEDPIAAGQVQNPASVLYGNPKSKQVVDLSWQTVVFQFVPTITATGTIRDAITGEFLEGVSLRWLAKNGAIAGLIYTQYPNASAYGTPWLTRPDGGFPADLKLPAVSLDLLMYKAGYSNFNAVGAIIDPPAGHHTPFGDVFLQPVDANGNRIADAWETLYFGGLTSSTNDPDADGQNNRAEYWSGTNPTNAASVFKTAGLDATNGLTIRWPVTPGRVYRIESTESLADGTWTVLAGPWTAGVGESLMQWTVVVTDSTQKTYRVQVLAR